MAMISYIGIIYKLRSIMLRLSKLKMRFFSHTLLITMTKNIISESL